jgi:ankyrin repeat protein
MTGAALYIHVADDGGVLVIEGWSGRSAWVTVDDLSRRLDVLRDAGGSVLLSKERGSPVAVPLLDLITRSGIPVVEARAIHPDAVRRGGLTATMSAAYLGSSELLLDLVSRGVDLAVGDDDGFTALMYAANAGEGDAVALLVSHGVNVNQVDVGGSTALMLAAQHGHAGVVKKLVAAGAFVTGRNAAGLSARDFALANGHERVAAMLLSFEMQRS